MSYINPKNMSLFGPHDLSDELVSSIASKHLSYKYTSFYPHGKAAEDSKGKILNQYTLQLASYSTLYMLVYTIQLKFILLRNNMVIRDWNSNNKEHNSETNITKIELRDEHRHNKSSSNFVTRNRIRKYQHSNFGHSEVSTISSSGVGVYFVVLEQ